MTSALPQLRAVTYNVHRCCGMDRRVLPTRIVKVLREIDADVVALQEVVVHTGRAREADQPRFIAEELDFRYVVGENRKYRGGGYGNVVLTRFPIVHTRNYDLSVAGNEPRGCLRVDIEVAPGRLLHVFNVHLGTAYLERRRQARKLMAGEILRGEGIRGPRIVLGDFNEWTRGLTTRLLAAHLQSADLRALMKRRKTYPGLFPILHLDHIYYDRCLRMERLKLHKTAAALLASDHLPLVGEFADLQCKTSATV